MAQVDIQVFSNNVLLTDTTGDIPGVSILTEITPLANYFRYNTLAQAALNIQNWDVIVFTFNGTPYPVSR